jgi:hypothetical protein
MIFHFNEQDYTLPSSLADITLQQRINFDALYGAELNATKTVINAMPDDSEKQVEQFIFLADSACKTFAFFTGLDLETIRTTMECRQVINVYLANLQALLTEEYSQDLLPSYTFNGEEWVIAPPTEQTDMSGIKFSEFQMMKSVILDLVALGDENWQVLPNLCALYLRKEGETAADALTKDGERKELFQTLPLDIALAVGNYIKSTILLYIDTLKAPE